MRMKKITLIFLVTVLSCAVALAQNISVTGVVKGDGAPLHGATVAIKGTTIGTVTNAAGEFKISAPAKSRLVVSFIGMQTEELNVANKHMEVNLIPAINSLDDVVVVAYGTTKRESVTGAISVMSAAEIGKRQTSNISKSLEGAVAGVQLTSKTGQPGSAAEVRIRGIGSVSASSSPLYVVDGVPFDGDLSSINQQDIESLTVLKDAASNALYGARGANGVILITTKKGRGGEAVVSVDMRLGINQRGVPEYNTMTDPGMYYETFAQSYKRTLGKTDDGTVISGSTGLKYNVFTYPQGEDLIGADGKLNPKATLGRKVGNNYITPDSWYDEAFSNNIRQEYNASVSGANEKVNYYMSMGYLNDKGLMANSSFGRYSARLKADYQAKSWLKMGANFGLSKIDSNSPEFEPTSSVNLFYLTRNMAPIYPVYIRDASGNILIDKYGRKRYDYGSTDNAGLTRPYMNMSNPIGAMYLDENSYSMDIMNFKSFAEISFLKDFKFTFNVGYDIENSRRTDYSNPFYGQYAGTGAIYKNAERDGALNLQQLLTWNKTFSEKHNLDVLLGHETYQLKKQRLSGSRTKLYDPFNKDLDNGISNYYNGSNTDKYATEGFLGRAQYNYDGKYFLSGSFRRDASSRFHRDVRWGNFWSVGASWMISRESFMEGTSSWLDYLKYKISYGSQGNDALENYYPYVTQYEVINLDGDFALNQVYIGEKSIVWETNYNMNTGFDFSLFGGRLAGSAEMFYRRADDLLFDRPVPNSLGYSTYPANIGSMQNFGFEFDINASIMNRENFRWDMYVNATHFTNKMLSLPPENEENGIITGNYIRKVGGSIYNYYLREWAGVDPKDGSAMWYKDGADGVRTTTKTWTDATRYDQGTSLPKLYGGFGTSVSFYGVDASIAFTYQIGGKTYDGSYATLMHSGNTRTVGNNWHKDILGAWQKEGDVTDVPRLSLATADSYANSASTRFLVSARYLNISNISVGYTLPSSWSNKIELNSVRVYCAMDNVALFSVRKGLDPRQNWDGSTSWNYSPIRTISGGVQVKF